MASVVSCCWGGGKVSGFRVCPPFPPLNQGTGFRTDSSLSPKSTLKRAVWNPVFYVASCSLKGFLIPGTLRRCRAVRSHGVEPRAWAGFASGPCPRFEKHVELLGSALGHFIFSLIGLKRILFTNYFPKALKAPPRLGARGKSARRCGRDSSSLHVICALDLG